MTSDLDALDLTAGKAMAYRRGRKDARRQEAAAAPAPGFTFYEFFAGGGMARAGLGLNWECLFANDCDFKKSATYKANWGDDGRFVTKDVGKVELPELPGRADLIWASFPCQDLSLAGMGAGLKGNRSGAFWPFWALVKKLDAKKRGPMVIVLENVCGALSSHGGKDFAVIADALAAGGYRFGAMVVNAVEFVPQSRQRLFIVAAARGVDLPEGALSDDATPLWHPKTLQKAQLCLTGKAKDQWLWWKLPAPPRRNTRFADLVEENPASVSWRTPAETKKLLGMMSPVNKEKVEAAKNSGQLQVGTVYKRTRLDEKDNKVQRAEVRFDDISGCLRTSTGGSSRQSIIVIRGDEIRSRLLSSREAARLMGLSDEYTLPESYNEAYHLAGDGVVVPVVRYLAEHLLEPIILSNRARRANASRNSVRRMAVSRRVQPS